MTISEVAVFDGPGGLGRLVEVEAGAPDRLPVEAAAASEVAAVFDGPGLGRLVEVEAGPVEVPDPPIGELPPGESGEPGEGVQPAQLAPETPRRGRPPKGEARAPKARREGDFYPTPDWQGYAGLGLLVRELERVGGSSGVTVVDPGAGEGHILLLAKAAGMRVHGIEKNPDRAARCRASLGAIEACITADFLEGGGMPHGAAAVAFLQNPPFSEWEEFIRESFRSDPVACVALGRAALLGSKGRRAFWSDFEADMYQHVTRASFTGDGETDKYDTAWFVLRRRRQGSDRSRIGEVFRLDGHSPSGQIEAVGLG